MVYFGCIKRRLLLYKFKSISGITPKSLSQKVDDFYHDQAGYSYV